MSPSQIIRSLPGGRTLKITLEESSGVTTACTLVKAASGPYDGPCVTHDNGYGIQAGSVLSNWVAGVALDTTSSHSSLNQLTQTGGSFSDLEAGGSGDVECEGCCGSGEDEECTSWTCNSGESCGLDCTGSDPEGECI